LLNKAGQLSELLLQSEGRGVSKDFAAKIKTAKKTAISFFAKIKIINSIRDYT